MQWWKDNIVAFFKAYGPWTALIFLIVIVVLLWFLGIDLGDIIRELVNG